MKRNKTMLLEFQLKKLQHSIKDLHSSIITILIESRKILRVSSKYKTSDNSVLSKDRIAQAKINLNHVFLTEDQKIIFNEIAKEASGVVPFSDFIHLGFILRSIRKWQLLYGQPIATMSQMNPYEQLRIGTEIFHNMKQLLGNALYIPDEKVKIKYLNEVTRHLITVYDELLSAQRFVNDPDISEIESES